MRAPRESNLLCDAEKLLLRPKCLHLRKCSQVSRSSDFMVRRTFQGSFLWIS